jgi:hypothetical protein
MSVMFAGVTL